MASHLPTDISAEFLIDGAWSETYSGTDLAARVRAGDRIRITRGMVDQQSAPSPISATATLNNRDNLFTNDNPNSALFGKIGLATQCRMGVKTGGKWDCHLLMADWTTPEGESALTVDKASLDVTDIDVRVEMTPWYPRNADEQVICGKYVTTGNQRSWVMTMVGDGSVHFVNSTTGADINATLGVIALLPEDSKRCAIRVTVDVNDGAGNRVFRFYNSDSNTIAGPWTLRSTGTFVGTTSLFNSTAPLEIGAASNGGGVFTGATPFRGKIHAVEVYNNVGGTGLVADFKPASRAPEDTTWVDGCAAPNTWTLTGTYLRLASDRIRVAGEISSLPDDWDSTGTDIKSPMTVSGIFQRYANNKSVLASAVYRYRRLQTNLTGYWPLEHSAWTPIPGALTGVYAGCTTGSTTGLDGSDGASTMTTSPTSSIKLVSSVSGPGTGTATFVFYFNLAALAGSDQLFATAYATSGATASQWNFYVSNIGFRFDAYASDGTLLDTGSSLFGTGASPLNQWLAMSVQLTTETTNVRWNTSWHAVGSETFFTHASGGDTYVGTVGQFYALNFYTTDAAFAGAQVAHALFSTTTMLVNDTTVANVSKGWADETVGRRMLRLAAEEDFAFEWRGSLDETPMMGPQAVDTLYANLNAAFKVDGGILTESRDRVGALYVTRKFLGNRSGLALRYSAFHLNDTPRPVNDNRYVVNDFTATSPRGGSARSQVTDPLLKNISDPPVGAGRWERGDTFNVADDDDQLPIVAARQTAAGAWPERRVPNLAIGLHRSAIYNETYPFFDQVLALDAGHPVLLTSLSGSPVPPNDLSMIVLGYAEVIDGFEWNFEANTTPAGPFQTPIMGNYVTANIPRMDATNSSHTVLNASITSTVTGAAAMVFKTDASGTYLTKAWVDSTNYPSEIGGGTTMNVVIDGEVITVSDIGTPTLSGGFNRQNVTVSARSVNSIIKAHSAGAAIFLAKPYYIGEM